MSPRRSVDRVALGNFDSEIETILLIKPCLTKLEFRAIFSA